MSTCLMHKPTVATTTATQMAQLITSPAMVARPTTAMARIDPRYFLTWNGSLWTDGLDSLCHTLFTNICLCDAHVMLI